MLTKAIAKYINSLKTKKGRKQYSAYILEGEKLVSELLTSQQHCQKVIVEENWLSENRSKLSSINKNDLVTCTENEMKKISSLQTPSPLLAIADIPVDDALPDVDDIAIVLDGLQDPGNLGTIIRTADWFGLKYIFASQDTVDAYNPKTVQSAMGSLLRVKVFERDLETIFKHYKELPVYAADMNGNDIRKTTLHKPILLLIGNEGSGIRPQWKAFIHQVVSVPRFGQAESLNAAVATAIICSYWKLK